MNRMVCWGWAALLCAPGLLGAQPVGERQIAAEPWSYQPPRVPVDEFSGPDSLAVLHTNGGYPSDPAFETAEQPCADRSTGVRGSSSRAVFLGFRAVRSIAGVRILWISPACGPGTAGIVAADADTLVFTAPGGSAGSAVTVAAGERKLLPSADPSRYVLVERVTAAGLVGSCELELIPTFNNVLCGNNIAADECTETLRTSDCTLSAANVTAYYAGAWGATLAVYESSPSYPPYPEGILRGLGIHFTSGNLIGDKVIIEDNKIEGHPIIEPNPRIFTLPRSTPDLYDTFDLYDLSGRLHAVMLHNRSSATISNLELWLPPLGTRQVLDTAGQGLDAAGAGSLIIPDVADWHPDTRFVRISDSGGVLKEIVAGYLDGHEFIVSEWGRGVHGTTAQAGAAGDEVDPVSGARIGLDVAGVVPWPTTIQGGGVPPAGLDDHYVERVYWDPETGLPDLPEVTAAGWSDAVDDQDPLTVASIAADYRVGLWIHLPVVIGERCTPSTPVCLAWRYTVGGVTYAQTAAGYYRVANDLSAERYRVYTSVGAGVPVDRSVPLHTFASRPQSDLGGLVDDAVNNIEVYKVNDYGVEGLVGSGTIEISSGTESNAPSPPADVTCVQTAAGQIHVGAMYFGVVDGDDAADTWQVVATGSAGGQETFEVAFTGDVSELSVELDNVLWDAAGVIVTVEVNVLRSADSRASDVVTREVTLSSVTLEETGGMELLHDERRAGRLADLE